MNPTNKPVPVNLGGKTHNLVFNLNTFSAFEEVSGKFFLDFLVSLQEALAEAVPSNQTGEVPVQVQMAQAMKVLRRIKIGDLHKFLWAACHTYGADGEPIWPYKVAQIGRMLDIATLPTLLPTLMGGASGNLPETATGDKTVRPINGGKPTPGNSGTEFGPSDDDVLALMTENSGD